VRLDQGDLHRQALTWMMSVISGQAAWTADLTAESMVSRDAGQLSQAPIKRIEIAGGSTRTRVCTQ
jgi:hypothetical protein